MMSVLARGAAAALAASLLLAPRPVRAEDTLQSLKGALTALTQQMQQMQKAYETQITALASRIDALERELAAL